MCSCSSEEALNELCLTQRLSLIADLYYARQEIKKTKRLIAETKYETMVLQANLWKQEREMKDISRIADDVKDIMVEVAQEVIKAYQEEGHFIGEGWEEPMEQWKKLEEGLRDAEDLDAKFWERFREVKNAHLRLLEDH